jgi:hypothetical protein
MQSFNLIYAWCMDHQLIVGIVSSIFCLAVPNTIFVKAGFFISQFVRKVGGRKVEEKLEAIVDGLEQGMKGDNKP